VLSSIDSVCRQCFDNDEVIFGGEQGWMSQWAVDRFEHRPFYLGPCSIASHPPKIAAGWGSLGRGGV
jgi:hypothetical protein